MMKETYIQFRCTEQQKADFNEDAKSLEISLSQFLILAAREWEKNNKK